MRLALLALGLASALSAAPTPPPAIQWHPVASPAAAGSLAPAMTLDPHGTVWLSWVELGADGDNTVRFATYDPTAERWNPARTIVADKTVAAESADTPLLAIDGRDHALAVWTDGHGGANQARSDDHGAAWTKPEPWSSADLEVEKFSLARLSDGRILAAWLVDGRNPKIGGTAEQLRARIVGDNGPDAIVDASVCDCCPTSLIAFLDGGGLVAYRGRTADDIRDIHLARFHDGRWDTPRVLNNDGWHITACPVNGPRLATDGSRIAAAWFTGADGDPRVVASFSPDAGGRWLMPERVDRGLPVGHVDTALLRDGAMLVCWVSTDGSLWLRRITPDFAATDALQLAPKGGVATVSMPRLALLQDYAGAKTAAELLVAYTSSSGGVHTLRLSVPEGELVNAERNCDCAPTLAQLEGFPIRGVITSVDPTAGTVQVKHTTVPGVFAAGSRLFKVSASDLPTMEPGRQFLGRIERRGDAWWLGNVQWLAVEAP